MKAVILAGGFGTRISEESQFMPKPMIEIGGKPILWHIMKHFSHYGINEFIICLGYKGMYIKDYFSKFAAIDADIEYDFSRGTSHIHRQNTENWKVLLAETGLNTFTGGRIKRIADYLTDDTFMLTYGDAVSDVDLDALIAEHKRHNPMVTITTVKPEGRFGIVEIGSDRTIVSFQEKNKSDNAWINGGYMVMNRRILEYIDGDDNVFERDTLPVVTKLGEVKAYEHEGFWQCMDTQRDKSLLESLWGSKAPWKVW